MSTTSGFCYLLLTIGRFYVIQLLHPIGNPSSVVLFTRWGRVGEGGQQQKKGPFDPNTGVYQFKDQFKKKSGTNWEQRHGMVPKAGGLTSCGALLGAVETDTLEGKYMWLERSFEDEDKAEEKKEKKGKGKAKDDEEDEKIPDSTLPPEIQVIACSWTAMGSEVDVSLF